MLHYIYSTQRAETCFAHAHEKQTTQGKAVLTTGLQTFCNPLCEQSLGASAKQVNEAHQRDPLHTQD